MEEVYVIKVRSNNLDICNTPLSEQIYSSSSVFGLAMLHLLVGCLTMLLGVVGILREFDTNFVGAGIWLGMTFSVTGVFGLMASKRWYEDCHIRYFLISSCFSCLASVLLLALLIYGIVSRDTELQQRRTALRYKPYSVPVLWQEPGVTGSAVTGNLMIAASLQFILSVVSTKVSWKGYMNTKKQKWQRRGVPEDLPPAYPGITPDILCHINNEYHVARLNPLCSEESTTETSSRKSVDYMERVQEFLNQALEVATQQQAVQIEPQDYESQTA